MIGAVLALATNWLTACATGGSEPPVVGVCQPIVECSREFQARAAEELTLLPVGLVLGDYSVMREQARVCTVERLPENSRFR